MESLYVNIHFVRVIEVVQVASSLANASSVSFVISAPCLLTCLNTRPREQFDGITGYEKGAKNLTWSYAAFLSAVRARTGQSVEG